MTGGREGSWVGCSGLRPRSLEDVPPGAPGIYRATPLQGSPIFEQVRTHVIPVTAPGVVPYTLEG